MPPPSIRAFLRSCSTATGPGRPYASMNLMRMSAPNAWKIGQPSARWRSVNGASGWTAAMLIGHPSPPAPAQSMQRVTGRPAGSRVVPPPVSAALPPRAAQDAPAPARIRQTPRRRHRASVRFPTASPTGAAPQMTHRVLPTPAPDPLLHLAPKPTLDAPLPHRLFPSPVNPPQQAGTLILTGSAKARLRPPRRSPGRTFDSAGSSCPGGAAGDRDDERSDGGRGAGSAGNRPHRRLSVHRLSGPAADRGLRTYYSIRFGPCPDFGRTTLPYEDICSYTPPSLP